MTKGLQSDEPHLPAYAKTEWGVFGSERFVQPTTAMQALWQVKTMITTLELGASVKVNDGTFLRPSFPQLKIDQTYKVQAHWEVQVTSSSTSRITVPNEYYYQCKPPVYDAWFLQEFKLATKHSDAGLIMETFRIHYDQVDARMRAGRECAATYIQALLDNVRARLTLAFCVRH